MSLWIPHQKKEGTRHQGILCSITAHYATVFALITCSHVFAVNHHYMQRIVWATSVQSMNGGGVVQKNYGQFPLLKVSNINLHSSKERKWETKEDKGKSMMHAL